MPKQSLGFKSEAIKDKCARAFGREKIGASGALVATDFKLELTEDQEAELQKKFAQARERLLAEG